MLEDPLYIKIESEVQPGHPPISVSLTAAGFGCDRTHARRVLAWMAEKQSLPTMAELPGSPKLWKRI